MRRFFRIRSFAAALLFRLVRVLASLMPRDPSLWIIIGWRRNRVREIFADNPKYFFLYVSKNVPGIRPVWLGKDRLVCNLLRSHGLEAYPIASPRGILCALRAGTVIVSALMQSPEWALSGGARLIQLWHGKSLKKTGYNSPYSLQRHSRFLSPGLFVEYHAFVAISEYFSRYVMEDFHVPRERIIATGLPKQDIFFSPINGASIDSDEALSRHIGLARSLGPKKLILYGPTFRPDGSDPLRGVDLSSLDAFFVRENMAMIITMHPKFALRDWRPASSYERISFAESEGDQYPLFSSFDLLITDYSSLSIDFLLLDKPVVHFAFDLETYAKGMGVYEELWELMPGPKVRTVHELIEVLRTASYEREEARARARGILFQHFDGNASERITKILLSGTIPRTHGQFG